MSALAKQAREDMKAKAKRLASADPHQKVDASSWTPSEPLNADIKTGMRPVSRQARKDGGKVEGQGAKARADRKPRGNTLVNDFVNRDAKAANDERLGVKHDGGLRDGGRARARKMIGGAMGYLSPVLMAANALRGDKDDDRPGKANGGSAGDYVPTSRMAFTSGPSRLSKAAGLKKGGSVSDGELQGTRPTGGRIARKDGGKNWIADATQNKGALHRELGVPEGKKIPAKKLEKAEHSRDSKTAKRAQLAETLKGLGRRERKDGGRAKAGKVNVNVIVGGGQQQPAPPRPIPIPIPPPGMGPQGPAGPPPGLGAGPPPGLPPGMPPPMPRKAGGRTYRSAKDMDAGALSGLGRLEKTEIQKHKR